MCAGSLHVALFEQVEAVGPILHHPAAWLDVLGMVIGRTDFIWIGVGKLGVNPLLKVAELIEGGGYRAAYAMAGKQVLVTHALQSTVERIFADTQIGRASCRERVCQYV